jgi:hypothetical protein
MRNNKDGSNPKVYRSDIEASRQENWWGLYAITVSRAKSSKTKPGALPDTEGTTLMQIDSDQRCSSSRA